MHQGTTWNVSDIDDFIVVRAEDKTVFARNFVCKFVLGSLHLRSWRRCYSRSGLCGISWRRNVGWDLLGGSLALALAALNDPPKVYLWVRNPETVKGAKALGISGVTTDLHEAVLNASLVILAVPVGAMEPLLTTALDAGLPAKCLITDVGSIKRLPHQKISRLLLDHEAYYIGSHPMAGSERNGLSAA